MLNKFIGLALASALFITSCGGDEKKDTGTKEKPAGDTTAKAEIKKPELAFDTLWTDFSKLIAGQPTLKYCKDIQAKDFYATHMQFADTSWKRTTDSMLAPISKWIKTEKITDTSDNSLCFYPLSGPDFLFGNAFFPNATNYVMLGLEPKGKMCDFRELKDDALKRYFDGIRQSMKYLNKAGYFVTSHMSGDFGKANLNGMVHMMLYMMARTNHTICDVYNVYIDTDGTAVRMSDSVKVSDTAITAVKIEFLSPDRTVKKAAYYFKLNASDEYLNNHKEFSAFVDGFGKRVSYMKSASCVLQNTNFAVMRGLVLNSNKILQDDTGVPYKYFDKEKMDMTLYGKYSMVIDDLSWCLQKELKKDLEASKKYGRLPFRISYIGNYGEGVMIYARKK
ncbi:MAG TPA: hypothetical protein VK177_11865 [Flavobacteriales bacterium]|nr:hypothetical protein [Flavobacteriales bacterium]